MYIVWDVNDGGGVQNRTMSCIMINTSMSTEWEFTADLKIV